MPVIRSPSSTLSARTRLFSASFAINDRRPGDRKGYRPQHLGDAATSSSIWSLSTRRRR